MSWLFAANASSNRTPPMPDASLWTLSTPEWLLAVGGNTDTCFWQHDEKTSSGWAVAGIGLLERDSRVSLLTHTDWAWLLAQQSFDATSLDGHFAILRWNGGRLECFTDQIGLRELYYAHSGSSFCVSTRLDWVARSAGRSEIDCAALGSRWLMPNQFSYASCVAGVERIGPGGHAVYARGRVSRADAPPWLPSFAPSRGETAIEILRRYVVAASEQKAATLSLGLSGGLDSRLLLALLTAHPGRDFSTHAFGDPADPDVRTAGEIAAALGLRHRSFHDPLPDAGTCLKELRSYVSQTYLTEPGSSYLRLRHYGKLRLERLLMIDGGFGEFSRRLYLNRVLKIGRMALAARDAARLLPMMRAHRADIFSADATATLERGALRSLEAALAAMPDPGKIGLENFADLLTLRMRVPNYGGPEQARMDGELLNFMPYIQPTFLRAVFGIPPRYRSNAAFHYRFIRTLNPALERFPLIKGGIRYRYGLSGTMAWITAKIKGKLFRPGSDPAPGLLLGLLKEFVLDTAHARSVTGSGLYDRAKVAEAVTRYYGGEERFRNTVDWWLTFELWRESMSAGEDHGRGPGGA